MALVLVELQRPQEALSYAQDALAMRRRLFTGEHPDVAQSLSSLVQVQRALGHADEALASAREALAVRQQCFPGDHILVAKSMDGLSSVLFDLGSIFKRPSLASAMPWRCTTGFIQAIIRERPFLCQTWPNVWENSARGPRQSI